MDSVGRMTWFVTASAKRKAILKRCLSGDKEGLINQLVSEGEKVNNELLQQGLRRDSIPSLCSTRWPSRVDCLSALRLLLNQRFLTFRCVPCVTIKDTDDVLLIKEGPQLP